MSTPYDPNEAPQGWAQPQPYQGSYGGSQQGADAQQAWAQPAQSQPAATQGGWGQPPQQGGPYSRPPYAQQAPYTQSPYAPQAPYGQQTYGQQTYGQPPSYGQGAFGAPAAPRGRSKMPLVLGGVVLLGVIVVAILVVSGTFTTKTFDQNALQSGVQGVLTTSYGKKVDAVSCPSGQKVQPGATFTCEATIAGQQTPVTVTVKDRNGTYEVARP